MFGKRFSAILGLFLALGLAACSKKEEPAADKKTAEPITESKPAPKAGEMVLIPAGDFIFGDDATTKENTAYPKQTLKLPAFWIDKYEVTNRQFLDFSIKNNYTAEGVKDGKDWHLFFTAEKANYPVVMVTWSDAEAYCKADGKRLPTEEEWEKAARGTDGRRFPWGAQWDLGRSNTYEAGLKAPTDIAHFEDVSPYGVYDMLGNVQEWTSSWYKPYKGGDAKKDPDFGQRFRVVRGMSSRYYGSKAAIWVRSHYLPNSLYDFGFRCAKDATPEEAAKAGQAK